MSSTRQTIEEVYEAIKSDRAIMSLIERIKGHEWVRVVEGGYLYSSLQTKLIDEQFFEFIVDIFSL